MTALVNLSYPILSYPMHDIMFSSFLFSFGLLHFFFLFLYLSIDMTIIGGMWNIKFIYLFQIMKRPLKTHSRHVWTKVEIISSNPSCLLGWILGFLMQNVISKNRTKFGRCWHRSKLDLDKFQPLTLKTTMRNNKLILASVLLCIDYLTSTGIISL